MSHSSVQSWSNNSNAPQVSYYLHALEKDYFIGTFIAAVTYGISVALFFRCMGALLNPVCGTKKAIKWGLVAQTFVMFSFLTIANLINDDLLSVEFVNNREFSKAGRLLGPFNYAFFIDEEAEGTVAGFLPLINQWLANGLLLYRCHVIYSSNYWVNVIPGLMHLACVATGFSIFYCRHRRCGNHIHGPLVVSNFSISVSLNVLLTLMIIARLALHSRNIRNAIGTTSGPGSLYTAIVVMLVESSALYTIVSMLYFVQITAGSPAALIFGATAEIEVIATFLIVLRVANRSALTGESVASGNVGSIHFRSGGGSTANGETLPDGYPMSRMEADGETSGVGIETVSREI